jgi:hypothetical protein
MQPKTSLINGETAGIGKSVFTLQVKSDLNLINKLQSLYKLPGDKDRVASFRGFIEQMSGIKY